MRKRQTKTARQTTTGGNLDAWHALVHRTMSVDELRRESENVENSDRERAAMRVQLRERGAK